MEQEKLLGKLNSILKILGDKELSISEQTEILMNVFLHLSIYHLAGGKNLSFKSLEEGFTFILAETKGKVETLAGALGKQAILMDVWLRNFKEK